MPVQPVLIERNHDVRTEPIDGPPDVGFELSLVDPWQHAVLVVEEDEIGHAERATGVVELPGPQCTEALRRHSLTTVSAVGHAEQRDPGTAIRAPGEQSAAGQRLVVWMGKDREQGTPPHVPVSRNALTAFLPVSRNALTAFLEVSRNALTAFLGCP